ncbi:MAG: lysophospholipid acyltransferase family protein [Candidatus Limnocylindrus sp.]
MSLDRPPLGMRLSESFGAWAIRRLADEIIVEGMERIPRVGPAILVGNHISWLDPILLACWLTPSTGRAINWMGKAEAMRWPLVGTFLRVNGVFGVRRGAADLEAFRLAEAVLREGNILGIYPEGTRSHDSKIGPFRDGAALLALRSGAPVIPVAVSGTERLWPRGALLPRRAETIRMLIGEPRRYTYAEGDRPALSLVAEQMRTSVAALLPHEYRP